MKTKTNPAKGTTTKKIRPVTVTIEGELAATIREVAKLVGFRADNWARQCIITGDLVSSNTDEAKEFRRDMARHEIGNWPIGSMLQQVENRREDDNEPLLPIMFPADAARLLHELCQAGGIHTVDYVRECFCSEIFNSLRLSRIDEGVPDFINNGWVITNSDRKAMRAVISRWNAQKKGAA